MKTNLIIILFLLLVLQASTQTIFKQQINPEAQHKITNQPSISADSCTAPYNLYGQFSPLGNDEYMLYLTWEMEPPNDGWINWDDGVHFSGIGCCPDISAAARWEEGQLADFNNFRISKMRVILNDTANEGLVFKIWDGGYETDLIYHDTIHEFYYGSWIEHELESDIYINSSKELLVGYTALDMGAATFTLGTDDGPGIAGYGDLVRPDNDLTWDRLADYGLSYNWNIQFYVEDSSGNEKNVDHKTTDNFLYLSGFNVYESINGGDLEFMEFFPYAPDTNYLGFQINAHPYERCYQLTAVWANPVDTCESLPATTKNNPDEDYVCFWLVDQHESGKDDQLKVKCQPNPFSSITTIEYQLEHQSEITLTIYNYHGDLIYTLNEQQQAGNQKLDWSAVDLASGLYFYRLEIGGKSAIGKLIKNKN